MDSTLDRLVDALARLNGPVSRAGRDLAAALLAAMVLLAVAQIVSRALFDHSLDWAEELARMALVWSAFLVAPFAYRHGLHVAITTFADAFSPRATLVVSVFVNLLVIWICALLLAECADFIRRGATIIASTMPIRMAWVYAVVPLTLALLISVGIELVLRLLATLAGSPRRVALIGTMPTAPPD